MIQTTDDLIVLALIVLIVMVIIGIKWLRNRKSRVSLAGDRENNSSRSTIGSRFMEGYVFTPWYGKLIVLMIVGLLAFHFLSSIAGAVFAIISTNRDSLRDFLEVYLILASAIITSVYLLWVFKTRNLSAWIKKHLTLKVDRQKPVIKGFSLIGGYDEVKKQLKAAVENIVSDKAKARTNGILLYGPPGCGKTYFAERTAEEFKLKFKKIHIDDIKSMWVNESASLVGQVFKDAISTKEPCVIVFEEIDELIQSRGDKSGSSEDRKVTNAFLTHMDDLRKGNHKVVVFATTNYYDRVDKAAVRKGRFDYHIKIDRPNKEDAKEILTALAPKIAINDEPPVLVSPFMRKLNSVLNVLLIALTAIAGVTLLTLLTLYNIDSFLVRRIFFATTSGAIDIENPEWLAIIKWPLAIATLVFFTSVFFVSVKQNVFKRKIEKRQKKIDEQSEKQLADIMHKIDVSRLAEYFEGRPAADMAATLNMTMVSFEQLNTDAIIQADMESKRLRRSQVPNVSWDSVILNDSIKDELKKICGFISSYKSIKDKFTQPLKGMILYGPPGTGKTLIARAIASNSDCSFYQLKSSDIVDKYVGETQKKIQEIYRQAYEAAPSVVFIDEAESLFERRDTSRNSDAVNQILQEIDGFQQYGDVVFTVMATNYADRLDDAVKSRLSYSIHIPNPDKAGRQKLTELFISKITHSGKFDYKHLALLTEGMSARDIENLINKAASVDFTRPLQYSDIIQVIESQKGMEKPVTVSKYTWNDLILTDNTLKQLKSIETIFSQPDKARALGIKSNIHAVFYGHPGTGKTHAAKVLANVLNADFREYAGGDFKKGIVGETETMIRDAFKWLRSRPSAVMFIDEADSVLMDRGSLSSEHSVSCVNQFLAELQGFEESGNNYAVIISTNRLDDLDPAVKSRFPIRVYFDLPGRIERRRLLVLYIKGVKMRGVNVERLVEMTDGLSGRDIANLINTAKMNALSNSRDYVVGEDFCKLPN